MILLLLVTHLSLSQFCEDHRDCVDCVVAGCDWCLDDATPPPASTTESLSPTIAITPAPHTPLTKITDVSTAHPTAGPTTGGLTATTPFPTPHPTSPVTPIPTMLPTRQPTPTPTTAGEVDLLTACGEVSSAGCMDCEFHDPYTNVGKRGVKRQTADDRVCCWDPLAGVCRSRVDVTVGMSGAVCGSGLPQDFCFQDQFKRADDAVGLVCTAGCANGEPQAGVCQARAASPTPQPGPEATWTRATEDLAVSEAPSTEQQGNEPFPLASLLTVAVVAIVVICLCGCCALAVVRRRRGVAGGGDGKPHMPTMATGGSLRNVTRAPDAHRPSVRAASRSSSRAALRATTANTPSPTFTPHRPSTPATYHPTPDRAAYGTASSALHSRYASTAPASTWQGYGTSPAAAQAYDGISTPFAL